MIRIEDISHVAFRAPDLDEMAKFLADFGIAAARDGNILYGRGLGAAPYLHITEPGEAAFAGLGFRAASIADVEALAASEGLPVVQLQRPGGGVAVTLTDPDGFSVEVVAGQTMTPASPAPPIEGWNSVRGVTRLRKAKRVERAPSHVVRLGHCVLNVSDFRRSERWYKDRFGLITSDEVQAGPGHAIGAFLRCDRGDTPTDHHTLFLMMNPAGVGLNHAAYEVVDVDDLFAGHERLAESGRTPYWGIGRHLLGSQVFDYWRDPWGHTLEHWTDGDLLTADDGSNTVGLPELLAVQWGATFPQRA